MSDPYPSIRVQPSVDLSKKPSTKQLDGSDKESTTLSRDARDDNMRDSNNQTNSLTQIHHISTPQMVAIVISIALAMLALALWYNTSTTMALYEREIRLAQRDAQDAKNQVNTLKEVLEIVGLKVPKKDDENEQR